MRASIPPACQDWANTKAAYRFFSNNRVTIADISDSTGTQAVLYGIRKRWPGLSIRSPTAPMTS